MNKLNISQVWLKLIFFVFIFYPIFIYSQDYQSFRSQMEGISTRAKWRIGPFFLDPTLYLDFGYDNNVYGLVNKPIKDYFATISPQVTAYLLYRKWLILSFREGPQYFYFFKTERERALNNSYSPSFRLLLLSRFVLSGGYQFNRAKLRTLSEVDRPVMIQTKGYSASLFFDTTRNTSLGFLASIMQMSFENVVLPESEIPLSRALDRKQRGGQLQFYYQIFSETFFFLNVGYTEYEFNNLQATFRNSYSYHANTGIRFPILGRVRGALSLGYYKFIPRAEGRRGFEGYVADTGLDFRLGRFSFRFQFQRALPFSLGGNIFYVEDRFGGGISFYLSQFIRLDYNISYGNNNYPEKENILMPDGSSMEIKRSDIYRTHSAGIFFRIIRNTAIGLTANVSERRSNFDLRDMKRLFVGASLMYDF